MSHQLSPALAHDTDPSALLAGEGMRAAIQDIESGYEAMIESWRKR
jgi:hypothetical protein